MQTSTKSGKKGVVEIDKQGIIVDNLTLEVWK